MHYLKKLLYQLIANWYYSKLLKTENEEQFKKTYSMAMAFNKFCMNQEIYLK